MTKQEKTIFGFVFTFNCYKRVTIRETGDSPILHLLSINATLRFSEAFPGILDHFPDSSLYCKIRAWPDQTSLAYTTTINKRHAKDSKLKLGHTQISGLTHIFQQ